MEDQTDQSIANTLDQSFNILALPAAKASEIIRRQDAEIKAIKAAVQKLHSVKGRYHTQIACADLFELCGLRAERPKKDGINTAG